MGGKKYKFAIPTEAMNSNKRGKKSKGPATFASTSTNRDNVSSSSKTTCGSTHSGPSNVPPSTTDINSLPWYPPDEVDNMRVIAERLFTKGEGVITIGAPGTWYERDARIEPVCPPIRCRICQGDYTMELVEHEGEDGKLYKRRGWSCKKECGGRGSFMGPESIRLSHPLYFFKDWKKLEQWMRSDEGWGEEAAEEYFRYQKWENAMKEACSSPSGLHSLDKEHPQYATLTEDAGRKVFDTMGWTEKDVDKHYEYLSLSAKKKKTVLEFEKATGKAFYAEDAYGEPIIPPCVQNTCGARSARSPFGNSSFNQPSSVACESVSATQSDDETSDDDLPTLESASSADKRTSKTSRGSPTSDSTTSKPAASSKEDVPKTAAQIAKLSWHPDDEVKNLRFICEGLVANGEGVVKYGPKAPSVEPVIPPLRCPTEDCGGKLTSMLCRDKAGNGKWYKRRAWKCTKQCNRGGLVMTCEMLRRKNPQYFFDTREEVMSFARSKEGWGEELFGRFQEYQKFIKVMYDMVRDDEDEDSDDWDSEDEFYSEDEEESDADDELLDDLEAKIFEAMGWNESDETNRRKFADFIQMQMEGNEEIFAYEKRTGKHFFKDDEEKASRSSVQQRNNTAGTPPSAKAATSPAQKNELRNSSTDANHPVLNNNIIAGKKEAASVSLNAHFSNIKSAMSAPEPRLSRNKTVTKTKEPSEISSRDAHPCADALRSHSNELSASQMHTDSSDKPTTPKQALQPQGGVMKDEAPSREDIRLVNEIKNLKAKLAAASEENVGLTKQLEKSEEEKKVLIRENGDLRKLTASISELMRGVGQRNSSDN
ncbi:hypothetical protein BJ508DRAFT_324484 [Ascobolus immersus RN42]|uniref:Uncharacterized protein n=1 Tax=Ascobolus immersus RN42 TaxID=1160509 RepID=A0A3N4ID38_ASCIM|nr:hypothetical protein BJ508DRAFT_324484 [Ascobolus immersus RN42]